MEAAQGSPDVGVAGVAVAAVDCGGRMPALLAARRSASARASARSARSRTFSYSRVAMRSLWRRKARCRSAVVAAMAAGYRPLVMGVTVVRNAGGARGTAVWLRFKLMVCSPAAPPRLFTLGKS